MKKEKRILDINNLVFSKSDIKLIAEIFNEEYQKEKDNNPYCNFDFEVKCYDQTSYGTDNLDLLEEGGEFDIKSIYFINLLFRGSDKRMEFGLNKENVYRSNQLSIEGNDADWVAGRFSDFEKVIKSVKPQQSKVKKYSFSLKLIFVSLFYLTIFYILDTLINKFFSLHTTPRLSMEDIMAIYLNLYIFCIGSSLGIAFYLSGNITSWVLDLWPDIEFDFGPEHLKIEKLRRKRIWIVISITIIPFIISILVNILT